MDLKEFDEYQVFVLKVIGRITQNRIDSNSRIINFHTRLASEFGVQTDEEFCDLFSALKYLDSKGLIIINKWIPISRVLFPADVCLTAAGLDCLRRLDLGTVDECKTISPMEATMSIINSNVVVNSPNSSVSNSIDQSVERISRLQLSDKDKEIIVGLLRDIEASKSDKTSLWGKIKNMLSLCMDKGFDLFIAISPYLFNLVK